MRGRESIPEKYTARASQHRQPTNLPQKAAGLWFLSPAAFAYFGFRRRGARASLQLAFQNKIWHASGMETKVIFTDNGAAGRTDVLESGGLKYDGGKPPTELIAPEAIAEVLGITQREWGPAEFALVWLVNWYRGEYYDEHDIDVGSLNALSHASSWLLRAIRDPSDARCSADSPPSSGAWLEVAKVLGYGARKYAPHNWSKGIKYSRVYGAALRHIFAFLNGEVNDSETGLNHLAHALCEVMFLQGYEAHAIGQCIDPADGKPFDDRPFDSVYTAKFAGPKTEPVPAPAPKTAASRRLRAVERAPQPNTAARGRSRDEENDPRLDRCPDCGPDGCDGGCCK